MINQLKEQSRRRVSINEQHTQTRPQTGGMQQIGKMAKTNSKPHSSGQVTFETKSGHRIERENFPRLRVTCYREQALFVFQL